MSFASAFALILGFCLAIDRLRPRAEQGSGGEFLVVAFLLGLHRFADSADQAASLGGFFTLGYVGWMLWSLQLPVPVSGLLAFSQLFVWTLFTLGAYFLFELPFPLSVAAIACLGTALFWVEWTFLPLWGTAQNFSCSSPKSPAFIALFGAAGGTWVTLCYSGLLAHVFSLYGRSVTLTTAIPIIAWTAGFLAVVWGLDFLLFRRPSKTLRVATFGWSGIQFDNANAILAEYQTIAREASERGARLLVTPEAAIQVQDRTAFRVTLCSLAQHYNLALAVGYFDQNTNQNCIDFVNARGEVVARYVKTHLVPVLENYTKGTGDIGLMEVDGIKVGGLVCQDDNFPDIARKYANAGVQLLAVPTHDWSRVKDIHFANHLWRALECRFALARAATSGISALTSANGKVAQLSDHFKDGKKLLVADIQVGYGKPTLYARLGDWFPIACGIAALLAFAWGR